MNKLKAKPLDEKTFQKYGRFAACLAPEAPFIGQAPIHFYRDLLPMEGIGQLAASVTQVQPMPLVVDTMEYHTATGEGFLCLDSDAYFCVAPATADGKLDAASLEAFYLPAGTLVYLHPGAWHYAPFPAQNKHLHSLVLLPQRTYANDCIKITLSPEDQATIEP